eukprot:scaffold147642_cov96-Cyclotella_meneghiniana.AAC.3
MMIAQPWRWDGQVRNFEHDDVWDYQNLPPGSGDVDMENYDWWVSGDKNKGGCKQSSCSSPGERVDSLWESINHSV